MIRTGTTAYLLPDCILTPYLLHTYLSTEYTSVSCRSIIFSGCRGDEACTSIQDYRSHTDTEQ